MGFAAFKKEWLLENRDAIEENADWNGLSLEVCGERLFHSMLVGKYDIYEKPLETKLAEAEERSAEVSKKDKDGEKEFF